MTLYNRQDSGARTVVQNRLAPFMQITGLSPGTIRYADNDVSTVELDGGAGSCTYTIQASGLNTLGPVPLRLATGAGSNTITAGGGASAAIVELINNLMLNVSLAVQTNGLVRLNGSSVDQVLHMLSLTVTGNGTLDIGSKAVVLDYTGASPLSAIRGLVSSGYAAGAWTGAGITSFIAEANSGTAVGFGEATSVYTNFPANFVGLVSVDSTSILIRHTLYGDANLNRQVNLVDFNTLAGRFGQSTQSSTEADFTYDGSVTLADFNALASRFGLSLSPDGAAQRAPFGEAHTLQSAGRRLAAEVLGEMLA